MQAPCYATASTAASGGRLPNKFGISLAPVRRLALGVCDHSLSDAFKSLNRPLYGPLRVLFAPAQRNRGAAAESTEGVVTPPRSNAYQSCPAPLSLAGKCPLTRGCRNLFPAEDSHRGMLWCRVQRRGKPRVQPNCSAQWAFQRP
jgi:hypothetical protein